MSATLLDMTARLGFSGDGVAFGWNRLSCRVTACLLLLVLMVGCPAVDPDGDGTCDTPKLLPPGATITDDIGVKRGDRADCKKLEFYKAAIAKVEYTVGTAFNRHDIQGELIIYDRRANVLQKQTVNSSGFEYRFEFVVESGQAYFAQFNTSEGGRAYSVRVSYQLTDPCKDCTANERCVEAKCVSLPKRCEPACNNQNEQCEDGRCVSLCGPCSPKQNCNGKTRECEAIKACPNGCRAHQVCSRGACRDRCRTCNQWQKCNKSTKYKCIRYRCPPCQPGKVCSSGTKYRCIQPPREGCPDCLEGQVCSMNTGYKCKPRGDIVAILISSKADGSRTHGYINAGRKEGVVDGMRGLLCGKYHFQVMDTFKTRARVLVEAARTVLSGCKRARIKR